MNDSLSTLHIVVTILVAALLVGVFGFVVPVLLSAQSTELVGLGFGIIILAVIGVVIALRNALGLKPEDLPRNDER